LKAIAAALDVDVQELRTTRLIPQTRLVRVQWVDSYREFAAAEQRFHPHAGVRAKMVPLAPEMEDVVDDLLRRVFADHDCIAPSESDLWEIYIKSVKEPLESLLDFGYGFLLLDEQKDLFLPNIPGLPPPVHPYIEGWRVRYYLLVPQHGCFRVNSDGPLHRFHEGCATAPESLLGVLKRDDKAALVFDSAFAAVVDAGGEEALYWCETCFPKLPTGTRLNLNYVEKVTRTSGTEQHPQKRALRAPF
jgi:hypothetical protein